MNESKRKFIINLSVAVLLIVVFLSFGLNYFIVEIENSSSKIVDNKKKIRMLEDKNSQLQDSKKQYSDIQAKMDTMFEAVIDKGKSVDFIKEAEKAASDNKVLLRINTPAEKVKSDDRAFISFTGFNFTVGGKFDGLMRFLYNIENSRYDSDIDNIRIDTGSFDDNNKDTTILTFDLKLYQKNSSK